MNPKVELEKEINDQLIKLHQEISAGRSEGLSQDDILQKTNEFETQWHGRLVTEQAAEVRGRKIEAAERIQQQDRDQRTAANIKDNAALRGMNRDGAIAYWENAPSRSRLLDEVVLAQKTSEANTEIVKESGQKYEAIRHVLTESLMRIEEGQEPDFLSHLSDRIARDHAITGQKEAFQEWERELKRGNDREH